MSPAVAERRPAAVRVLQTEHTPQPTENVGSGLPGDILSWRQAFDDFPPVWASLKTPADESTRRCRLRIFICHVIHQVRQCEQRARRIVAVRHATRQIGPGPTARVSAGVRMALRELLALEPGAYLISTIEAIQFSRPG